MATLVVEIPSITGTSGQTSKTLTLRYTPPANVSGKLCRLSVGEFLISHNTMSTMTIFKLEASFPQPFGKWIRKKVASGIYTTDSEQPNRLLCTNLVNSVYTANPRSIITQLSDGPMDITFTLSAMSSDFNNTIVGPSPDYQTPDVLVIMTLTPVDRNNHFEKLESYSSGPSIRF